MATYSSRSAEFASGQTESPPYQFTPDALNQQYMPSGNGMSTKDAARRSPNGFVAPTQNGYGAGTYSQLFQTGYSMRI